MVKLTKSQISALAYKLVKELNNSNANKELYESDEYKNFESENADYINICKLLSNFNINIKNHPFNSMLDCCKKAYFKDRIISPRYIQQIDIENEITLSTIDAVSLQEIIDSVKAKFTVNAEN